jgi:hypothetical protein
VKAKRLSNQETRMSVVNEAPRKLRVTVILEELGSPESPEKNSNEPLADEMASRRRKLLDYGIEGVRQLFWWLF